MKKHGNRRDGEKIQTSAMARLMTYTKDRRDADVYICKKVDCTNLVNYINERKKSIEGLTYFHIFVMAIGKVIYNRPKLNYFIVNHTFYKRNEVSVAYVAKVDFSDDAKELQQVIRFNPNDTLETISNKIKSSTKEIRSGEQKSGDDGLDILGKLPRWVLTWIVAPFILWLDKHDLLPYDFAHDMIYNSSVIISNLGSIKCGAIYHNITDFGTSSILMTVGNIHKEPVVLDNGEIVAHDVVDIGINLDERIGDGVYFSKACNLLEHVLTHPELLDEAVETLIEEKSNFTY